MSVAFSCAAAGRRRRAPLPAAEHVRLEDAATGAAALDVREVDALGLRHAAGDGGDADAVGQDLLLPAPARPPRPRLGRRGGGLRAIATRLHAPDDLADRHGVARLGEDLSHHPGGGSGNLGVDLVGRDLDDRLVGLDGVAWLLGPLEDHALGDRLAHGRHRDLDGLAGGLVGGRLRRWGSSATGADPVDGDLREHGADVHGVALGGVELHHGARHGRRDFGVDLVGRDLNQRLVFRDLVTLLLAPFQDGALGNRVTHHRHDDLYRGLNCHLGLSGYLFDGGRGGLVLSRTRRSST